MRLFLSERHQRKLHKSWILDRRVDDPLFEERLEHIRAQLCAALALRSALIEIKIPDVNWREDDSVDLKPLIAAAVRASLIDENGAGILNELNRRANLAKHLINFRSFL